MLRRRSICTQLVLCMLALGSSGGAADYDLLWSSTGGGWRSMIGDMAFANVFGQAGLISEESSSFSAIATNSGASWFSLQFFYSPVFFNRTLTSSPAELGRFVTQWMQSYKKIFSIDPFDITCSTFGFDLFLANQLGDLCYLIVQFGGDWANATHAMLEQASEDYGDAGLATREAGPENRVDALKTTDLMIQIALAPNSRIPPRNGASGTMSYLGPASADNAVYTTPITVQYTVIENSNEFRKAGDDILSVYTGPAFEDFSLSDFESFFLYPPPQNATLTIGLSAVAAGTKIGQMREPFGGGVPSVNQVASASSAVLGTLSGLVPSLLAQTNSVALYTIQNNNSTDITSSELVVNALQQGLSQLYDTEAAYGVAVCSQWPRACTETDGRFVDGGYTDGASLALTLGQYQEATTDTTKLLKVIVTNTFNPANNTQSHPILAYFYSPDTQNIEPGAFVWPPGLLPLPSLQIFAESLDLDTLFGLFQPVDGANATTALINATTIDNEVYGVMAGQLVEILLINLNSPIPTSIIGPDSVEQYTAPLSQMAVNISSSKDLLSRVKSFAKPSPESASSGAPTTRAFASQSGLACAIAVAVMCLW